MYSSIATTAVGGFIGRRWLVQPLLNCCAISRSLTVLVVVTAAACGGSTSPPDPTTPPPPASGPAPVLLPGAADAPAVAAIPETFPDVRADDYEEVNGMFISRTVALLRLAPDARVGDVNALLSQSGAAVLGGVRGVPSVTPGILTVRWPTATRAAFDSLRARFLASPAILGASADVEIVEHALPPSGSNIAVPVDFDWTWEVPSLRSGGGNWGFERSRVPQMWNLNDIVAREGVATRVGVWEPNRFAEHPDIVYEERVREETLSPSEHGLQVAGVIGAVHGNGGIEGVSPFSRLVVGSFGSGFTEGSSRLTHSRALGAMRTWIRSGVRVLNVSFGFDYAAIPDGSALADEHGRTVADVLRTLASEGERLPFIVVSAGNYSIPESPGPTSLAGMFQNAGSLQGVAAIVIVESLAEADGGGVIRAASSSVFGNISAPGHRVLLLASNDQFATSSGTSFAAPFVAGVAAYLYSLYPALPQPTLTSNPLADLLIRTATPVRGGAAPAIDAFAAVMEADVLAGGSRAERGLVDIDDGTPDGNTRIDVETRVENLSTVKGSDGQANMADFRRWRDWWLQAADVAELDGRADHPKRDLNGDGLIGSPAEENVFPRGDFNGDGILSLDIAAPVPAVLGGGRQTDLEIFQRSFDDETYSAAELPGLVRSADVHLGTSACELSANERIRYRVVQTDGTFTKEVIAPVGASRVILTAPIDGPMQEYTIEAARLGGDGTVRSARSHTAELVLGSDRFLALGCESLLILNESLPIGRQGEPYSVTMRAEGGEEPLVWSNLFNTLPTGLGIDPQTGIISGTPTVAITRNISIAVRSGTESTFRNYRISIEAMLAVVTGSLPSGSVGAAYSIQLAASGTTTAPTWRLAQGRLPSGLTLSPSGRISGTPTEAGAQSFSIEVESGGRTAQRTLSIQIQSLQQLVTVTVELRPTFVDGQRNTAEVTSSDGILEKEGTNGACTYDSRVDGETTTTRCVVRLPRGSTTTLTARSDFPFFWQNCDATTRTTCGVIVEQPRNVQLFLNRQQ